MLVRCPKCNTGFNLPEEKIPAKGAKVKCSACTHTFRVRIEDGAPHYFYKKNEVPKTGETMIGAPVDLAAMGIVSRAKSFKAEQDEGTKPGSIAAAIGFKASKSSSADYDPFPLAGRSGEQPTVAVDDLDVDLDDLDLDLDGGLDSFSEMELDVDDLDFDGDWEDADLGGANSTQFGAPASGIAERQATRRASALTTTEQEVAERGSTTQLGGAARASQAGIIKKPRRERPPAPDDDIFDAPPAVDESLPVDMDPFGQAFSEPLDGDGFMGSSGAGDSFLDDMDAHEAPVPVGASRSEMNEIAHQQDGFAMDGASFDPNAMEAAGGHAVPTHAGNQKQARSMLEPSEDIQIDEEALGAPRKKNRVPKERQKRQGKSPRTSRGAADRQARDPAPQSAQPRSAQPRSAQPRAAQPRPAKKPLASPAYAQQIGGESPVRRALDAAAITLAVGVVGVGVIAYQTGGFVDFANFGHMVEVAFAGADYVPREEWKQVVEIPPPEPPPEEPLRLRNVRAHQIQVGDDAVVVVSGRIRNYSLEHFRGVKVEVVLTSGDKELAKRRETVGQSVDFAKLDEAKSVADVRDAMVPKLADIGKEGKTHFAVLLDGLDQKKLASRDWDYSVEIIQ